MAAERESRTRRARDRLIAEMAAVAAIPSCAAALYVKFAM